MNEMILFEHFDQPELDKRLNWFCPPAQWSTSDSRLVFLPEAKTDYWQKTHYGFSADNGHFLYLQLQGDFILTGKVQFYPAHKYDQAGLLVRFSPDFWIKTSVEYENSVSSQLGAVVTRQGYSDWSTQNVDSEMDQISLRIRRENSNFYVEYLEAYNAAMENETWVRIRMAHLQPPENLPIQVGLYAASPKEAGFRAEFDYLKVDKLH